MAKNSIRTYSTTAASNTDVGGVDIQGTAPASNMDDSVREIMSHLAETNAGTAPVDDTWSFCDPADATKKVRLDAGNVTAGQTRVLTVPDSDGTVLTSAANPTLVSLEGLTLAQGTTLYATAADTLAALAKGTAGQFYVMNAGATAPEWASRPTLVSLEGLSLVQGDLIYATAADTLARLAKGTAGQELVMNAGATAPVWRASPLSSFFESSEFAVGAAENSAAHGLGGTPRLVMGVLRCATADEGYSVGDELTFTADHAPGQSGVSVGGNATNVFLSEAGSPISVVNKAGGGSQAITNANWRWVIRAWA